MSLEFIDGFDHYATADITKKKWTTAGASTTIQPTDGRRGGGCMRHTSSSPSATLSLSSKAARIVGFSLKVSSFSNISSTPIAAWLDSGTSQCELRLHSDGTLRVTRNGTAVTDGVSTFSISTGAEYYIEWKVTIADSIAAGSCKVRVNGADIITVATGQDLKNTATAAANQFRLGPTTTLGTTTIDTDDLYI